jgi:hypothetical protein
MKTNLLKMFALCFILSSSFIGLQAKNTNVNDCFSQFQGDWAFCSTLGCSGILEEISTLGGCYHMQAGCESGALNRYSNCHEL